ncbi:hypothetical protein [Kitasatospora sp. NBC_00315]|uniref:hypothetical protein n=1 Tax=Kitasatospora sp. NBC_00315 TaxID=2975963 RepID=UPI0032510FD9
MASVRTIGRSTTGRAAARATGAAGALACAVLLLAACSSGGGGGGAPTPARLADRGVAASPAPVPTPTAPPYGSVLVKWINPLNTALAKLPPSGDLTAFGAALEEVRSAAASAGSGLELADEPPGVSTAHRQVLVALDSLVEHITKVQADIEDRSLCATGSALASFGQADALVTLPTALQSLAAAGYPSTLTVPQTGTLQQRALDNGTLVREGGRDGEGELTIENGGSSDAVLSLALDGKSVHSIYVGQGKNATLKGIEDGTYTVYFAGGTDWDPGTKAFTRNCGFSKFDDTMAFETGRTYTTWTLTLQPTVGGNATTSDVPEGSYPLP